MAPAAERMAEALAGAVLSAPAVPVIANVTAQGETVPERIRELLVQQVTATVRWRESMAGLSGRGIDTVVELGTGKVLTGLLRRIDPQLRGRSVETPGDVEAFLNTL